MALDRFLRIGLASSLAVNAVAISLVGVAQTSKPAFPGTVPATPVKPPTTRLVEIQLPPEALKKIAKEGESNGESDEGSGQRAASKPLSDSREGPEGKLGKGNVAAGEKPRETPEIPTHPKARVVLTKPARVGKGSDHKRKTAEVSRNIKVAIRANQTINVKLLRLMRPGPLKTGGYHGIVDLRKLKLTARLLAVLDKADAKLVPNKLIGKQHVDVIGKIGGKSVCIPTGGHTIYGSDLKIYLGKDIELNGTKFCVPGGLPGIPGSASQTDPRQPVTSLSQSAASQGGGFVGRTGGQPYGGGKEAQMGGSLEGYRPLHETGDKGSVENGPRGNAQGGKDELDQKLEGGGFEGKGERGNADSHGAADVGDAAEAAQSALQERYLKYASGALRGVPEAQATARPLHLPQSGPELNNEIPGVEAPKDQRRLVDDPKEHRGSSGGKESPDPAAPKLPKFVLNPKSVGSVSSNGDVLWTMAAGKTKGKATRRVKGHGKKDGGGDGTGLLGVYFHGDDLRQEVFRRPDRIIDFDWTFQPVDTRMPVSTYFSVRWTGEIRPKFSETYTIYSASDDGCRIWIDGRLVISNWTDHSATEDVGLVNFTAGQKYSIKVEYYANGMTPSVMKLYWQSAHQPKEYIPQSCLFYPTSR